MKVRGMTREQELWICNLTERDTLYQQLRNQCQCLEVAYGRILGKLMKEERTVLERYIALCEEMDHRRLRLAMAAVGDS